MRDAADVLLRVQKLGKLWIGPDGVAGREKAVVGDLDRGRQE